MILSKIFIWHDFMIFFIVYKICSTSRFEDQCSQLQRGDSKVRCQWVQDSIECAQRIRNKTADFGVFSAESALQLASLGWSDLSVINELRHKERLSCKCKINTQ